MRRREFIAFLASAAASQSFAQAQQSGMPVIGFLNSGAPGALRVHHAAFGDGLKESGYVEGQNVTIEHRFADGRAPRRREEEVAM